jgi:hypothetical protein
MNSINKINNGGESICGKGGGGLQASKLGPNDDPSACGDCSAKGNINTKKLTAKEAANNLFGFNPFQ